MDLAPQIFTAKVMHKRLSPKKNSFTYGVYYLALPLPAISLPGKLVRFDAKDLGYQDGSDPSLFAKNILAEYGLLKKVQHIMLITMPRVLGYIFNPVSFYLCLDGQKHLRAVIAEVHNTFGEQHTYLCAHPDHHPIGNDDWLEAEKVFHVSPFFDRSGYYRFRFAIEKKLGIWIDYLDKEKNKQLLTSLVGKLSPLNKASLNKSFWTHPLVTLKTITLIHWQALKLVAKRIRHISKPEQHQEKVSTTHRLAKIKKN